MNREAIRRDLNILMDEALRARIPILIGTCGTCGTDSGVNWTRDIAIEVARELVLLRRSLVGVATARKWAGH
ncbi:MAG: 3-methylaspartate ammonia-lyase [Gammaproteobacteria bacterium]|nr:3-methylaspartate ammonia-lyase [Gammaproteobacteria bacterium]